MEKIKQPSQSGALIQASQTLALYYGIGRYICQSQKRSSWGDKILETISSLLQQEMPGLKGFSKTQLKRMKSFYLAWQNYFRTPSDFTNNNSIADFTNITDCEDVVIGPLTTDQFDKATLDAFLTVQFTHHYEILQRTDTLNERLFYIYKVASEFWSVDKLKYNIREQLYLKEGTMPNNFAVTLHDGEQKQKAMRAFRKNYKLDFIEIDDVDEWDEHKVEAKIVENIKRFIMALGADFVEDKSNGRWSMLCETQESLWALQHIGQQMSCPKSTEKSLEDWKD